MPYDGRVSIKSTIDFEDSTIDTVDGRAIVSLALLFLELLLQVDLTPLGELGLF